MPSKLQRVLAFDPGFERLGVAVVEKTHSTSFDRTQDKSLGASNRREILLYSACIRTDAKIAFAQRLLILGKEVEVLIKKWKPDAMALEDLYFAKNAKTAMKVAEVRGMLVYLAATRGLALFEYTPLQVKVAVTGWGHSDKRAVAVMIPRLIALPKRVRLDDELDAIAVGLTCLACEA